MDVPHPSRRRTQSGVDRVQRLVALLEVDVDVAGGLLEGRGEGQELVREPFLDLFLNLEALVIHMSFFMMTIRGRWGTFGGGGGSTRSHGRTFLTCWGWKGNRPPEDLTLFASLYAQHPPRRTKPQTT